MKKIRNFVSWLIVVVCVLFSLGTSHATYDITAPGGLGYPDAMVIDNSLSPDTGFPYGETSWIIQYGTGRTSYVQPMFRDWLWYRIGDTDKEASFTTLTEGLPSYNSDSSAVTVVFTDKQIPARFTATVTFSIAGKSAYSYNSTVKKTITIRNLTASELDFHLFSYSDLDISAGGTLDNVAIVKAERALQTGFLATGAPIGRTLIQTSTLKPSAYSIDTMSFNPGSILDSLDKTGPTTLVSDAGPNFENTDMQFAFQYDLKVPAGGTSTPFDITKRIVDTKPLNLTYSQAGGSCADYAKNTTYQVCVDNTTNLAAVNNVVVAGNLKNPDIFIDNKLAFVSATDGGVFDATNSTITWTLPTLATGATKCFQAVLQPNSPDAITTTTAMVYSDETFPAQASVTTALCNYPPRVTSVAPTTALTGVKYSYQIAVTDVENNPITFTLVRFPVGMTMDAKGLITWTPTYDQQSTSNPVTVDVSDGRSIIHYNFSVAVNWQNMAPTAPVMQTANATIYQPLSYQVIATDPDNQPLTYTTSDPLPTGLTMSSTGILSGTLTASAQYFFNVKVTDTWNASVMTAVVVDVATAELLPPTINTIPNATISAPAPFSYAVTASDPQGQVLTYTLSSNPTAAGLAINQTTGAISWSSSVAGSYAITVTATNTGGKSSSQSFTLTVNPQINPPIVNPIPNATITAPAAFNYSVVASDPQGQSLAYSLPVAPTGMTISPAGAINWSPSIVSKYNITVRVTNTSGLYTDVTFTLTVNAPPQAPVMTAIPNATLIEPASFSYQVSASDPQNLVLSYSLTATPTAAGLGINSSTGLISWPTSVAGTYTVIATATNSSNTSASRTFTLTVNPGNHDPVLAAIANQIVTEDTAKTVAISATDADGDTITYSVIGGSAATVAASISGTTLTLTPAANYSTATPISFSVTANDGKGGSNSKTFTATVTAVNDAPVAANGTLSATEDTVATGTLVATDVDNTTRTYSIVAQGTKGTVTITNASTGAYSYTPAANQNGTDSFTFKANDGSLDSNIATVTVTIAAVNDAPVLAAIANQTSIKNTAVNLQVQSSDADGNTLTFSAVGLPTGLAINPATGLISGTIGLTAAASYNVTVTVTDGIAPATTGFAWTITDGDLPPVITNPGTQSNAEGSVINLGIVASDPDGTAVTYSATGLPDGLTINSSTGVITGTVAFGAAATNNVVVTVTSNSKTATANFTWTVTKTNLPPTMTAIPAATITAPAAFSYQVAATDPNRDVLSYTLSGAPSGMTISTTGLINWATSIAGTYNITAKATDPGTLSASQTFTLTVKPSLSPAPVITSTPITSATENKLYNYRVLATDPNGRTLSYSFISRPDGMSISSSTGLISWTPGHTGSYGVTVRVRNSSGYSTTQSFTITVSSQASNQPVVEAIPNAAITAPESFTYQVKASDPQNQTLSYSLSGQPSGMSIDSNGLISWPVSVVGTYMITAKSTDSTGLYASRTFTLTVKGTLSFVSTPVTTAYEYKPYAYQVKAVDSLGAPITYSLTSAPSGMKISSTGNITWTPYQDGTYRVTVKASTSTASITQTFTIVVKNYTASRQRNSAANLGQISLVDILKEGGLKKLTIG